MIYKAVCFLSGLFASALRSGKRNSHLCCARLIPRTVCHAFPRSARGSLRSVALALRYQAADMQQREESFGFFPLFWSGKRDSDPRPQPWQGCALPTELFPHNITKFRFVNLSHLFPERRLRRSFNSFFSPLALALFSFRLTAFSRCRSLAFPVSALSLSDPCERCNLVESLSLSDCECKDMSKKLFSKTFVIFFAILFQNFHITCRCRFCL